MRRFFIAASLFAIASVALLFYYGILLPNWFVAILAFVILLGFSDISQKRHAVKRNFPVIGNFRYMLEAIRPEIQQYFIENNTDGRPIDRNDRSVAYQRAKKESEVIPFGTQEDLYEEGAEWVCHSMYPKEPAEDFDRVHVGSEQCKHPYKASILNISAMSYGSLSRPAVEALNKGASIGNFYHNTGEGGIAPAHKMGGDLVWQIGTGYFGCRTEDGGFNADIFSQKAQLPEVKMIELKISQGAKPGKGGLLPGAKVTSEISDIRGVPMGKDVVSPAGHKEFSDAAGLLRFIKDLRDLSGGKPVGFKMCIGRHDEFLEVVKQIEKTGILPDFITVDGAEGGTGAAPLEFSNAVGTPLKDGLSFVSKQLQLTGLKKNIRIIASGKSITGFHMIRNFALGADMINSARGMMLALGCIQALRCHTNLCPVGITTNKKELTDGLHIPSKAERVANYHSQTLKAVHSILEAMGKNRPSDISLSDIYQRQSDGTHKTFSDIYL